MYTHVVFFKVKDRKDIPDVAAILRSMEGRIEALKDIEVGINDIESDRNYDVVLITRHESKAQMFEYQESVYHQNTVLPVIRALNESTRAVDFEA